MAITTATPEKMINFGERWDVSVPLSSSFSSE